MKNLKWVPLALLCSSAALGVEPESCSGPAPGFALATSTTVPGENLVALASTDEKKRVPKDDEEKKKQEEAEKKEQAAESKDDGACWGMCIFGLMDALFSGDESATTVSPLATQVEAGGGPRALGSGVLVSAGPTEAAMLELWSGPGGAALGYEITGALPLGTHVEVTARDMLEDGAWLEVRTRSGEPLFGWVEASSVDWVSDIVPLQPSPELPIVTELPTQHRPPFGAVLGVDVSYLELVGPVEVREEYKGGVRFGLSALFVAHNTLQVGVDAGYGEADGDPLYNYDYQGDTRRDSPTDSQIQIFDAGLRLGQYLQVGQGPRIYWGVGAVYYWVRESADIDVLSLPSELPLGTSSISKSRYCWGADVAVGGSYPVAERIHVGLQARGFWIPWNGQQLESLTLDHIGKKTIVGVGISANVRFDVF